jgi:hypothetical protein
LTPSLHAWQLQWCHQYMKSTRMRMAFCISHTAVKTLLETYMCISSKEDVWRWNSRSLYRSHLSMCCFFLQS